MPDEEPGSCSTSFAPSGNGFELAHAQSTVRYLTSFMGFVPAAVIPLDIGGSELWSDHLQVAHHVCRRMEPFLSVSSLVAPMLMFTSMRKHRQPTSPSNEIPGYSEIGPLPKASCGGQPVYTTKLRPGAGKAGGDDQVCQLGTHIGAESDE